MNTEGARFVVLIPHRDCNKTFHLYKRRLFAAGLEGAFSFPALVPLALLSRPFTGGELKALSLAFRGASLGDGRQGWIRAGEPALEALPAAAAGLFSGVPPLLYGPLLDLPLPRGPYPETGQVLRLFSRPVLAAALVRELPPPEVLPEAPPLSFRAAALANMVIRPLDCGGADYSFEWRIGKPVWLPPVKAVKKQG